jgi:hypothetical protein
LVRTGVVWNLPRLRPPASQRDARRIGYRARTVLLRASVSPWQKHVSAAKHSRETIARGTMVDAGKVDA